jgi:large subunit ribosomal protein L31e
MVKKEQRTGLTETAIDTTINIHKLAHRQQFKHKAPRAVTEVKKWVAKLMRTTDVRIDPKLNQFIWSQGVRNLPHRVRVRISRKRNEEEGSTQGEFYSLVQHVHVEDFSGKLTEKAKVSA